jgi:hypothetical protein
MDRGRIMVVWKAFSRPYLIFCYLAAQVIRVSTIFGTRKSMTEPPRFLPIASMSPDLNLRAAIPIKKGVAAIIAVGPLHPISSETAHGVCELLGGT